MVLLSETRLTAVAQQVMCAQAGASGWQAFWGAPLESRGGGGGGIWTRRPGGGGHPCTPRHPNEIGTPAQRGTPGRGGLGGLGLVALHPVVPCPGRPWTGVGVPVRLGGLRRLLAGDPQPGLLGPGRPVRGTGRPLSWWEGISTLTSTACYGPRRLSCRPSLSAAWWTRTSSWRRPPGGPPSARTKDQRAHAPRASTGCRSTCGWRHYSARRSCSRAGPYRATPRFASTCT